MVTENQWYRIENEDEVFSPSLLVYPERIESNIRKMVEIAGDVSRLRPHVKTHKMAEIIKLQMKHGIYKFKCATISEAEMVARCGAKDILLAMQPVGPDIERFFRLKRHFRMSNISCIADSEQMIVQLSDMATGMILRPDMDRHKYWNEPYRYYRPVKKRSGFIKFQIICQS